MIFHNDLDYELTQSIKNVLNSDFSSKEISDFCNVSYTTINELRNGKRVLTNSGLQLCLALYRYSLNHNLNEQYLYEQSRKGSYNRVNLNTSMEKVIVSFDSENLFAYGLLKETSSTNIFPQSQHKLQRLYLSDSIFITDSGSILNCSDFGYQFKCRYGGTGPNNLLSFITKYSNISPEELKKTIFTSEVVEYDFKTDTITGRPAKIPSGSASFYSLDGKLIILLNNYDNSISNFRRGGESLNLESAASDINFLKGIMHDYYDLSTKIKNILYIPKHPRNSPYTFHKRGLRTRNDVHIVIQFEEFEIWLPYSIHQTKGDIFNHVDFKLLLENLEINYNVEQQHAFASLFTRQKDIDEIQVLPIEYSD